MQSTAEIGHDFEILTLRKELHQKSLLSYAITYKQLQLINDTKLVSIARLVRDFWLLQQP